MLKQWLVAAVAILVMATFGYAGDRVNMKPGKWEITSQMKMTGMPAGMQMPAMTHTQCIKANELVPDDPNPQAAEAKCEKQDFQIKGDTVTWTMVCTTEDGTMTSTGRITYKGTTFDGEVKTSMPGQGMEMTSVMKGRRVGDCN